MPRKPSSDVRNGSAADLRALQRSGTIREDAKPCTGHRNPSGATAIRGISRSGPLRNKPNRVRVTIVARDPELGADARRLHRLDEGGLRLLEAGLSAQRTDGDPFGFVILDSLSRLKPPELEESANDAMAAWAGELQRIAEAQQTYILLIHHQGHGERSTAKSAGRGASAVGQVAQTQWLLELVPGSPNQRRLKVDGNAVLRSEHLFEVAPEDADSGSLLYFRPVDPTDGHRPEDYLAPDEAISTRELARRLAQGEKPSGSDDRLARELREAWERSGLVLVEPGPRRSQLIRRGGTR